MTKIKILILFLTGMSFAWGPGYVELSFGGVFSKASACRQSQKTRVVYDQTTEERLERGVFDSRVAEISGKGADIGAKFVNPVSPYFAVDFLIGFEFSFGDFNFKLHDYDEEWVKKGHGDVSLLMLGIGFSVTPFTDTNSVFNGMFFNGAIELSTIEMRNGEHSGENGNGYRMNYGGGVSIVAFAEVGKLWRISEKSYLGGYFRYTRLLGAGVLSENEKDFSYDALEAGFIWRFKTRSLQTN